VDHREVDIEVDASMADSTAASAAYPKAQRSVPSGSRPSGGHTTSARAPPIWATSFWSPATITDVPPPAPTRSNNVVARGPCFGAGTQPWSSIHVWLPCTPVIAGSAPVTNAAWFA